MKVILLSCFFLSSCSHYVKGYDGYTQSQIDILDASIVDHYESHPKNDGVILGYTYTSYLDFYHLSRDGFKMVISDGQNTLFTKKTTSNGLLKTSDIIFNNNKPIVMFVAFETLSGKDLPENFVDDVNKSISVNYGAEPGIVYSSKIMTKNEYKTKFILNKPSKLEYVQYKLAISDVIESISVNYDKSKSKWSFNRVIYRIGFLGDEHFRSVQKKNLEKDRADFINR